MNYSTVTLSAFISTEIQKPKVLLDPWLTEASLNMVFGARGCGKTWLSLSMAYAISAGSSVLGWTATQPHKTLYVDGEMNAFFLQERFKRLIESQEKEPPEEGFFRLFTPDLQDPRGSVPDLASKDGQKALDDKIGDATVVFLDNISCLCRSAADENDAGQWAATQDWLKIQRANGRCIVLLHHAGKSGKQRGSSKREDLLDTVVSLTPKSDGEEVEGAAFTLRFDKARHLVGKAKAAMEVELTTNLTGGLVWTWKGAQADLTAQIVEMYENGLSQRDIAEALKVDRTTVYRRQIQAGILKKKEPRQSSSPFSEAF